MKPKTIGIIHSQLHAGETPLASVNTSTAIRFIERLKTAVSEVDSGTTIRGKRILRSSPSRTTIDVTELPVASMK